MFNTIYCCLAEEVFSYIEEENIPNIEPGSTAKIYFPFLYKQNIYTNKILVQKNGLPMEPKVSSQDTPEGPTRGMSGERRAPRGALYNSLICICFVFVHMCVCK